MEEIKDTVTSVMQGLAAKKTRINDNDPQTLLKRAFTKREQEHIKFHYFRKGTLSLYVDSSSWLYSFTLRKEDLLNMLNKKSGTIKDIRFRIGEIK